MKNILFILSIIGIQASAQNWDWAKSIDMGSGMSEEGVSMGVDKFDNLYITGNTQYFTGGNGSYHYDLFWKFDKNGNQLWHDTINGVSKVATDVNGFCYLMSGSLISKYNSTGQKLWARSYSCSFDNITINPLGGVIAVGFKYIGTQRKGFIYRCNPNGDTLWTKSNLEIPNCVTVNISGEIFFGSDTNPDPNTGNSGFLEKLDSSGNILFTKTVPQIVSEIGVDNNNNIYLTGSLSGSVNINGSIYNTNNQSWAYIIKYNPNGGYLWHKVITGDNFNINPQIALDDKGSVYLSSSFYPFASIDNYTFTTNASTPECLIVKVDSSGITEWGMISRSQANYSGMAEPKDLLASNTGDIFITGHVTQAQIFGSIILPNSGMYGDLLVAKINQSQVNSVLSTTQNNLHLKIFPNPASSFFNILYFSSSTGILSLQITNGKGQVIHIENISYVGGEISKTIDIGRQAKGIYFVEISLGNEKTIKKIIVE